MERAKSVRELQVGDCIKYHGRSLLHPRRGMAIPLQGEILRIQKGGQLTSILTPSGWLEPCSRLKHFVVVTEDEPVTHLQSGLPIAEQYQGVSIE